MKKLLTKPILQCSLLILLLIVSTTSVFAQRAIKGKITDDKGSPLEGANITVKGASIGTHADANGNYSLNISGSQATLVVSYVGYDVKEINTGSKGTIDVTLVADKATNLADVVVVGFGTQKKVNLTGAVSQVKGEELENRPVANIGQALQGLVPNLNLTTGGDPGGLGTNATFNIRGNTNIPTNNSAPQAGPLFIVDGVPVATPMAGISSVIRSALSPFTAKPL